MSVDPIGLYCEFKSSVSVLIFWLVALSIVESEKYKSLTTIMELSRPSTLSKFASYVFKPWCLLHIYVYILFISSWQIGPFISVECPSLSLITFFDLVSFIWYYIDTPAVFWLLLLLNKFFHLSLSTDMYS